MSKSTVADDIRALETRFWNAMKDKDGKAAAELTAEGSIIVGAQGVSVIGRAAMEKMTGDDKWQLKSYRFDDKTTQTRLIGDDVAITGYTVHEELLVGGKPVTLEAHDASVWQRQGDRWLCVLHTESVAGDPFGRK